MIDKIVGENIIVTGGSGFIGRYVLDRLISGGVKPFVLTRNLKADFFKLYESRVKIIEADILDKVKLKAVFQKIQPTEIIHLAGCAGKKNSAPDDFEKVNYQAAATILDLALETGVKKIIITGTADEYGFQPPPHTEAAAVQPVSNYAISKNKAVEYALKLFNKHHLPVVILRPYTIYGIGQPDSMFVSQAVEHAVENKPFEMSEGKQKRDLLFVEDFADAIMKALPANNIEGEIFNVGSGKAIELRKLAEKIWRMAGADPRFLKIGARQTAKNELHDTEADISKINAALDWEPKITLDNGLSYLVENKKQKSNERKISVG